ncbi:MAG: TIM barrel protein [Planctomycetes bacterium]|nr:TIM barrel protein [Planctomycetota bacterium]
MRMGGAHPAFNAKTIEDLKPLCETLDKHGLSAIMAPKSLSELSDDECAAFGERARELGLVIGEAGFWENIMTADADLQSARIETIRTMLRKADIMGCNCVVTSVGTKGPGDAWNEPHPYMFTEDCKAELRDLVLRILDGLDLKTTKYCLEAWCHSFFYKLDDIKDFIGRVDHPNFAVHLDQMNLVTIESFYQTTDLVNRTFDLLGEHVVSLHMKDIQWDFKHMFLKWDEVLIGDGVLDYATYLQRIAQDLPEDIPCYCEHLRGEDLYAENFKRLHEHAQKSGLQFKQRQ